jgi:hypothetical protein
MSWNEKKLWKLDYDFASGGIDPLSRNFQVG